MILGLGIDLIETSRIEQSIKRHGDRFLNRVFVKSEIDYCKTMAAPARHFAARFAAKEAASKAFGTGIGKHLGWKDIEISRMESGQPKMILHGNAVQLATQRGVKEIHVSLTHHDSAAAAVVVFS